VFIQLYETYLVMCKRVNYFLVVTGGTVMTAVMAVTDMTAKYGKIRQKQPVGVSWGKMVL